MDVEDLAASTERRIERLQQRLMQEQQFLKDLRKRVGLANAPGAAMSRNVAPTDSQRRLREAAIKSAVKQQLASASHRASRPEKRALALQAMRNRPGLWRTQDLAELFSARGIDPDEGTPPKNILWHLSREGLVDPAGHGAYNFDPDIHGAKLIEQEGRPS